GQGAAPGILVVVDQHVSGRTPGDAVLGRDQLRIFRFQLAREVLGECPDLLLKRPALNRDIDVDAARTSRFGVTRNLPARERSAHAERRLAHLVEAGAGNGVEIEVQIIGAVYVVAAGVPGIEIDAAEIHYPEQRSQVLHDGKVDDVARGVL